MSTLKFRPDVDEPGRDANDPLPFPGAASRHQAGHEQHAHRRPHPAELALERAQRRLDNLREVLGPAFGREDEQGPRAA